MEYGKKSYLKRKNIKIQSYKHDGNIHRVWSETTILKGTDHVIIGGNDHTLVTEK